MEDGMSMVDWFRRSAGDEPVMVGRDESTTSGWSPRARTMTIIGAALASWVVVFAIIYLVGTAVHG